MKRILVFDTALDGHHLEYIHHLYDYAVKSKNIFMVIAVPESYNNVKHLFTWEDSDNVRIRSITSQDYLTSKGSLSIIRIASLIKSICREYSLNDVFFVSLMAYLPFLPFFFFFSEIRLSGIVYKIYLYEWTHLNRIGKVKNIFLYSIFILLVHKIFILNDKSATRVLNYKWKTNKFVYLPDPYVKLPNNQTLERSSLGIVEDKIVFFHFGQMSERKGTLDVLDLISKLSNKALKNVCFIFAGCVSKEISEVFYYLVRQNCKRTQIIVMDEFCSYEKLSALTQLSDYLVIPYHQTSQSSGVISYGAQYRKPVIVRNTGLISKLVKKYHMGYIINDPFVSNMIDSFEELINRGHNVPKDYLISHSVLDFNEAIFKSLC